ncbi:gamma-glutamyltransferase [Parashewanella spongiae]|uniref:Glutathione hydrolase proenzyme n=1 Tax=Parashewanella spongiae TaxID=342950 RepID=A0A3A6TLD3_9GAMM|nr:gamma-glutamyltransferase [Parashewanella spongiae]MCL1078684.1 gamma-glutamyltransferase [Parashewanella spongiae]RJY12943.1 gamma-glutamyltransferase [Parashewanella spongiae]
MRSLKTTQMLLAVFVSFIIILPHQTSANPSAIYSGMATAQPVWAKHGMVSSQEALASQIGIEVLKNGGNAVDAAVAVGFALAVTLPRAGNLGGGGFMLVYLADKKKTIAIDYREMAPSKAHKDIFLNEHGNAVAKLSREHGLAVGVPGTVLGLTHALEKYGTLSLKQVISPAIKLAKNGIKVTPDLATSLASGKRRISQWPSSVEIFYKENGDNYEIGDRLFQTDLSQSLELIARHGSKGFYKGRTAQKIVSAVQEAGGIMTLSDLENYSVAERKPVTGTYRGYQIVSMPPPSSGGVHIIEMLNILENYPINQFGHNTAQTIHLMSEAMKRAYADRSEFLGDPDFTHVPLNQLTSKLYAKELTKSIALNKATPSDEVKPGKLSPYESDQTTHFSVVDQWGNAVSNTYTLNFSYGSGLVAKGTGILLNNEMDDFSAKAGVPNGYDLIGGSANEVSGGKRPLSSMSPTIVFENNKPFIVTGSPGGSRIITTTLQIIMNVIDHRMNIAEATNASRVHHQWLPDEIRVEKSLNGDTIRLLKEKGHTVKIKRAMGSTQSIEITDDGLFGASDLRRGGSETVGY